MHAMADQSQRLEPSPWDLAAAAFLTWRGGDRAALDELVRVMTPILWQVVRSYRLDADVAADTIQATWLAFVRSHESIADPQAVGKWLTTSARRLAARASARGSTDPVEDEVLHRQLPAQRSAESTAISNDENARLWRAVLTLDERCQRLLRVVAFEQRPDYERLADDLGMPVGSIGPTRGRCLAKLRRALEPEGVIS